MKGVFVRTKSLLMQPPEPPQPHAGEERIVKDEATWKQELPHASYKVLRLKQMVRRERRASESRAPASAHARSPAASAPLSSTLPRRWTWDEARPERFPLLTRPIRSPGGFAPSLL